MGTTSHGCKHNASMGFDYPCIECDPTPDDPRLHSIGITWGPGGKEHWHSGLSDRETIKEMAANAKRYGIEPERTGVSYT